MAAAPCPPAWTWTGQSASRVSRLARPAWERPGTRPGEEGTPLFIAATRLCSCCRHDEHGGSSTSPLITCW